jgi:aminoglycoside phosphotransferase (APT) family kinase protein
MVPPASAAAVRTVERNRIGTGQMGSSVRYILRWEPEDPSLPRSVVGKFPSDDERSRAAGAAGAYAKELGFYRDLQPHLEVPTPRPIVAEIDPSTARFVLLMSDLRGSVQGDQLAGCDLELAAVAAETIATLHAPTWGRTDEVVAHGWIPEPAPARLEEHRQLLRFFLPGFRVQLADHLSADDLALGDWVADHFVDLAVAQPLPRCIVHNDFRLDNLLIDRSGPTGPRLTVVDWQTIGVGAGPVDVAYFVGTGLHTEPAEADERAVVERYRARLAALGVDAGADDVWRSYVLGSISGYVMAVIASQLVVRTERGDAMFALMASRSAAMTRRLGLAGLVA